MTAGGPAPRKIRLLWIIPQLATGGAELQLAFFLRNCDRRRFDVSVLHYEAAQDLAGEFSGLGIPVKYLDRGKLGALGLLRAIRREIRSQHPDVVACRLPSAYRFGRLAALGVGVPVLIAEERTVKRDIWIKRVYDRLCNRWTDAWAANSRAVEEHLVRDLHVRPDRIHVVYNGIDLDAFTAAAPHPLLARLRGEGKRVILNVGRLNAYKNQALFLRVCDRLRRKFEELAFVLCGEGELRGELESLARQLGLAEQCHFLGLQKKVAPIMAAADLMLQTSDLEGLPNAVIEAMAAGVPVVATNAGGTGELIENDATGLIVPVGDEEGLVAAASRLLDAPVLARKLAEAASEHIRRKFPIEATARAFESLVERLLRQKGADLSAAGADSVPVDGRGRR